MLLVIFPCFSPLDKPNKHVTGDPESTVFVARLDPDTTEGILITELVKSSFFLRLYMLHLQII